MMEHLAPVADRMSAIIVTTPQAVALADAAKCLSFTRAVSLPVLGLIENMSGYVCPCCGEVSNVFSTGGGQGMARREGLTFLGSLPVDTELVTLLDAAEGAQADVSVEDQQAEFPLLHRYERTASFKLFHQAIGTLLQAPEAQLGASSGP
ncbi:hypothetical protein EXIGLDRAFT_762986 [Exidia glandulosa HHB12029]|uniref:P-loop containing nucleoside triphosphate hydrolase protein n=1 Tax=Exidia glandulosa HHB12029 TaxID=1314781 RepID=A0A165MA98_EXIGL|nr:hypothetical protein EXIGLDRAFT_762986 [Exidia glandulosa HHB12029]